MGVLKVIGQGLAHVAVVSIFSPASLVGMDHRTASDAFYYGGQFSVGFAGHPLRGIHDGAQAEVQPMHRVQVPLDGAER